MFYLKKIMAVIECSEYKDAVDNLAKKLQEQGIELETVKSAESVSVMLQPTQDACLWFTDSAAIVKTLRCKEFPVLAFLHEKNREQDFSAALYACEEAWDLDADYMDKVYRRYKRLPWEILQTDRCIVRETVPEDADAFWEIYREPSVTRYTAGLFPNLKLEKQYINDYIDHVYGFYGFGVWTILQKDTNEIIGRAGFSYREGFEEPELGFLIGKLWQRQGYAEEVCRAILKYGWDELEFAKVRALVHPENEPSLGLCRKLGMLPMEELLLSGKRYVWLEMGCKN